MLAEWVKRKTRYWTTPVDYSNLGPTRQQIWQGRFYGDWRCGG